MIRGGDSSRGNGFQDPSTEARLMDHIVASRLAVNEAADYVDGANPNVGSEDGSVIDDRL